jgi:DNA-binding XRE family transcriptional regulator
MAVNHKATPLKRYRLEMGTGRKRVSQEKLAHRAGTAMQTLRCAENGGDVLLSTAISIWLALNAVRAERGLEEVTFQQLWLADHLSTKAEANGYVEHDSGVNQLELSIA